MGNQFNLKTPFALILVAILFVVGIGIVFQVTRTPDAEGYPLREAVECHPRCGLPNFLGKVEAGETVKIAYLGGSITDAPGWRVQSREWFQTQFPASKFEEIHAAIGGTGSDLGVFRLRNDVLRHKPDLLFVEFAVNDGSASPERIHKAVEGIIRQTWQADPTIDICFVYTVSIHVMPDLRAGRMQRSASAMEELADHYEIPSIHLGIEITALEASGDLLFESPEPNDTANAIVFSEDGVHPHVETGHRLYTDAIIRSWPAIREASGQPEGHSLPKPFRADNWEAAKQVAIAPSMLKGDWETLAEDHPLAEDFSRNMPVIYKAQRAGSSLEFQFRGTTASVFDLLGPDGGTVSIQLDDRKPAANRRIDAYCTYHRMAHTKIATETEDTLHSVRITLTDTLLDKRDILFEKNREDFDETPEKYAEHTWYVSSLLIIGDLSADHPSAP